MELFSIKIRCTFQLVSTLEDKVFRKERLYHWTIKCSCTSSKSNVFVEKNDIKIGIS